MVQVYQNIAHILLMLLLLVGSAFFSGAETAFFNLSTRQINILKKSNHKLQKLAASLLKNPGRLLSCFLFGNMTVNVLFFTFASVLTITMERQIGITAAMLTAALTFMILVLFGEILPKSLAYTNSQFFTTITAPPVYICLRLFTPVVSVLNFLIIEPTLRLLLGPSRDARQITTDEFKSLIEASRKRGLITADEDRLLTEVIKLGFLKVRDCLRPRVDMVACLVTDTIDTARDLMKTNHLTKIPVYAKEIDNIVGMVQLRQILLQPDKSLDKLVQNVNFIPEQKTVESLIDFFRKTRTDTAIVVDEYGGIAGSISLEDIAEELLGPIEITTGIEPIIQTGPFEFQMSGDLAIHDWVDTFGIKLTKARFSTIGGLVTALLGKIPKAGDVAYLKNLKFTVQQVQNRRIETVILTFEPIKTDD